MARVRAFRRCGRLSTIVPMAPVTLISIALLVMNTGWIFSRKAQKKAVFVFFAPLREIPFAVCGYEHFDVCGTYRL
jgi:hypothetical protein